MVSGTKSRPLRKGSGADVDGMVAHLAQEAGVGAGEALAGEHFLRVAGDLLYRRGEAHFNRVLGPLLRAVLHGEGFDGRIDAEGFQAWMTGIGVDPTEAKDVCYRVPGGGEGALSPTELLAAVRAHHFGKLATELLATAAV